MRYSGIDIPVGDYQRLFFLDYEYVDRYGFKSTKGGSLEAFKAKGSDKLKYQGAIEGGIEVFNHTAKGQGSQVTVMDKLILIPESHPMFNIYIIQKLALKIFTNSKSHQPDMSYNELHQAIKQSVLKNLKL